MLCDGILWHLMHFFWWRALVVLPKIHYQTHCHFILRQPIAIVTRIKIHLHKHTHTKNIIPFQVSHSQFVPRWNTKKSGSASVRIPLIYRLFSLSFTSLLLFAVASLYLYIYIHQFTYLNYIFISWLCQNPWMWIQKNVSLGLYLRSAYNETMPSKRHIHIYM